MDLCVVGGDSAPGRLATWRVFSTHGGAGCDHLSMANVQSSGTGSKMPAILASADQEKYADRLLREYCTTFQGRFFDTLAQDNNRDRDSCRVTAEDLIAVQMLSVKVPPDAAHRILVDEAGIIGELLEQVPDRSTPIWEVSEAELEDDRRPLSCLWNLLRRNKGKPLV